MSVQAKFYVTAITPHDNSDASTIHLNAVCRGAENAKWSSATPCGSMQMTVLNTVAVEQFTLHEEYVLTFEHSPKPKPGDGHEPEPFERYGYISCARCGLSLDDGESVKAHPNYRPREIDGYAQHREMYGA